MEVLLELSELPSLSYKFVDVGLYQIPLLLNRFKLAVIDLRSSLGEALTAI